MTYKDITIKQYFDILEATKEITEPIELTESLIKIIFNEDLANLELTKANKLIKQLDFLNSPYKPNKPKKIYKINDIEFRFISDITKITTAQYIDFQTFIKQNNQKMLLNCLFVKDTYGEDNSDLIYENLTIADYLDCLFFFQVALQKLTKTTLDSSLKKMKKLYKANPKQELLIKIVRMKAALLQLNEVESV